VKRTRIAATLLVAIALFSISCGSEDKIASVAMGVVTTGGVGTGTYNLIGLGGTLQLAVLANYTSGKQIDETNFSTFTIVPEGYYCVAFSDLTTCAADSAFNMPTPPPAGTTVPTPPQGGITVSSTGMVTAVDPGICSWVNLGTLTQPGWAYTGWYEITATYRGFKSNIVAIPVGSAANAQTNTNGQCGPVPTT